MAATADAEIKWSVWIYNYSQKGVGGVVVGKKHSSNVLLLEIKIRAAPYP